MERNGILITRAPQEGKEWGTYLKRKRKADVYYLPTIKRSPVALTPPQRKVLARLASFDWIVFTSAAAPGFLSALLKKYKIAAPRPGHMPNIVSRANALGSRSVVGSVLLLRTTIASKDLPRALRARGARVTDLAIYRTTLIKKPDARTANLILRGRISHIIFASPSAVEGFSKRMHGDALKAARELPVIGIGPKVGQALSRARFNRIRVARTPTIEGMAAVMHRF